MFKGHEKGEFKQTEKFEELVEIAEVFLNQSGKDNIILTVKKMGTTFTIRTFYPRPKKEKKIKESTSQAA